MKTIIFVWNICPGPCNMSSNNYDNFWGIGDIIRGIIQTYIICKKLNLDFYIDFFNHPISKYLNLPDYTYKDYVKNNLNKIHWSGHTTEQFINNSSEEEPILLMTNEPFDDKDVTESIKEQILNLFVPTEKFKTYYLNTLKRIGLPEYYSIIHFRLGDDYIVRGSNNNSFEKPYKKYIDNQEKDQIVLSDSYLFKEFLKEKNDKVMLFRTKYAYHFGREDGDIKDTLLEFMIVLNSNRIKTYSVHWWTSGFVLYPSVLKKIKLIKI